MTVTFPYGVMGLSTVCDGGMFQSYLFIFLDYAYRMFPLTNKARLLICALLSPAGKGLTSFFLVFGV